MREGDPWVHCHQGGSGRGRRWWAQSPIRGGGRACVPRASRRRHEVHPQAAAQVAASCLPRM